MIPFLIFSLNSFLLFVFVFIQALLGIHNYKMTLHFDAHWQILQNIATDCFPAYLKLVSGATSALSSSTMKK